MVEATNVEDRLGCDVQAHNGMIYAEQVRCGWEVLEGTKGKVRGGMSNRDGGEVKMRRRCGKDEVWIGMKNEEK